MTQEDNYRTCEAASFVNMTILHYYFEREHHTQCDGKCASAN